MLGYYEMPDDDRPPERIWLDDKALAEHFEAVSARYRDGGNAGRSDWESIPDSEMQQNELTARLRG